MSLNENYKKLMEQTDSARESSDLQQPVRLVAVTKTIDVGRMEEILKFGIRDFGENRVQEIREKYDHFTKYPDLRWHQIGYLQSNKVKYIIDKVALIHSLDRYELAKEIDRQAKKIGKIQDCLLQIKVSEEENKKGADKSGALDLTKRIVEDFSNIRICGIMGMAPYVQEVEQSRRYFKELKELFELLKSNILNQDSFCELSMGMSNDFQIAIEEGATIIRVGSALFDDNFAQ